MLDNLQCETSLERFVRSAWHVLNPGRELYWGTPQAVMCLHLEAVARGEIDHLLMLVPPGTTKSTIVSVCYPAWRWATDPSVRFLVASNESDIADRDSRACRNLIRSDWYRTAFMEDEDGNTKWSLRNDQNEKEWYETTATGHRQALTVSKNVSGKKGDELIVDDPNDAAKVHSGAERRNVKRWYSEAFYNRVVDFKKCRHIMTGQHTHPDDLQSDQIKSGDWTVVALPERGPHGRYFRTSVYTDNRGPNDWLRPDQFSEKEAETHRRKMGPTAYSAQHQQKPTNPEGRMFDRSKVRLVQSVPIGSTIVRYWDTAASTGEAACYSSGVLMARTPEGRFVVMGVDRGRWVPSDRNNRMRNSGLTDMRIPGLRSYRFFWEKGSADSGIERDANLLAFLAGIPAEANPARGDKMVRAEPFSAQWAGGNVDVLVGDWNEDYLDEMEAFPDQPIKDSVDASSGAFNRLAETGEGDDIWVADEDETTIGQLPAGTFRKTTGGTV